MHAKRLPISLGLIAMLLGGAAWVASTLADGSRSVTVVVKLNPDRTQGGELTLVDEKGKVIAGPFPTLGKAANNTAEKKGNPKANSLFPFGDTPTGTYTMRNIIATSSLKQSSYGPHGAIVLEPTSGEALVAKGNGRTGLWIHGGDPGPKGGLRRTNGCLRLSNDHMQRLVEAIAKHANHAEGNRCEIQTAKVTVYLADGGEDYDEGDPPTAPTPVILFP